MTWAVAHSIPGRLRLRTDAWEGRRVSALATILRGLPGVHAVDPKPAARSLRVSYDASLISADALVDAAGAAAPRPTKAAVVDGTTNGASPAVKMDRAWHLATATLALAAPLLPLATPVRAGLVLASGAPVLVSALQTPRRRGDMVEALTLVALTLRGQYAAAAALAWFRAAGDFTVRRFERGALRSLRRLIEPGARSVTRLEDGAPRRVPLHALRTGDLVSVDDGAEVPVDGTVIDGEALVSEQTITGEPLPVERRAGDRVFAATTVAAGGVVVRAERLGDETTVGRMARVIEAAAAHPSEVEHVAAALADRQAPRTLVLSVLGGGFARSFDAGIAIAVADLGMAARVGVPAALIRPLATAARDGVVVKGARVVEELARVDAVVIDKTGTLTFGVPQVTRVVVLRDDIDEARIVQLIAASEHGVRHPVARAVARLAAARGVRPVGGARAALDPTGVGLRATVDGSSVAIGGRRFMESLGVDVTGATDEERRAHAIGGSPAFVTVDGRLAGLLVLEDEIRPEAPRFLRALRERGVQDIVMVTGDQAHSARTVAAAVGLDDWRADLLPEDKARIVRRLRETGRVVAMVGDGVNDALALHEADVGVALGGGPQLVAEASDVVVVAGDLLAIIRAIDLAREALERVETTVRVASSVNIATLGLASFGFAPPLASVLLSRGATLAAAFTGTDFRRWR